MEDGPSWRPAARQSTRGHAGQIGHDLHVAPALASIARTRSAWLEAEFHDQRAAGPQHALGIQRPGARRSRGRSPGEQRHVRFVVAHLALQAGASRSAGRRADSRRPDPAPRARMRRARSQATKSTRAPSRRALSRATRERRERNVRGADLALASPGSSVTAMAPEPQPTSTTRARRAPARSAVSTTCSVSGRGIRTSGLTRNSRP